MLRTIAQYAITYLLGHTLRPYVLALFDSLVVKLRSKLAAKLAPVVLLALMLAPLAHAQQPFNKFGPANGILKGATTTYMTTAAVSADVISLWSGTCNSSTYLRADGTCTASGGSSPLTTKGDLFGFDTADARVPVGTNGYVLMANSGFGLGLTWFDPTSWGYIDASYGNANYAPKLIGRNFVSSTFNDGDTVNQSWGAYNTIHLSGSIATLTLEFNASQPGGSIIRGGIDNSVATVTWVFAGGAGHVGTPPTSLAAGDSWAYIYDDFNNLWWPFK